MSGWDNPVLKESFFLKLGEASDNRFLLTADAIQKQTKRSVDENQVAKKIDYKIIINYSLSDLEKNAAISQITKLLAFLLPPSHLVIILQAMFFLKIY